MTRRLALCVALVLAFSAVWAGPFGFFGRGADDGSPTVCSLFPRTGWTGDTIHILGRNFGETVEANLVMFGDLEAEVVEARSGHLKVTVPGGLTDGEEYDVTVTVGELTSSARSFKAVEPGPPVIEEIRPESGPVGTCVKLYGENLGNYGSDVTVLFGATETSGTSWGRKVYFYVPDVAPQEDVPVQVKLSEELVSNEVLFTVTETPAPVIEEIDPPRAPAGRLVMIRGENLAPGSGCCRRGWFRMWNKPEDEEDGERSVTVTFDGTDARILANSRSRILVVVPAGLVPQGQEEAEVTVVVTVGDQTAEAPFTVVATPPPVVESIEPDSGTVGTKVTIRGENLGGHFAEVEVLFDDTPAARVWSGWWRSSICAVVPAELAAGEHVVTVKVDGVVAEPAEGATALTFTVEALPVPVIESIEPGSGPVGSRVVIRGENLGSRYLEPTVMFGDVPAEEAWVSRAWRCLSHWGRHGDGEGSVIVVVVPDGLTAGDTVPVTVAVGDAVSEPVDFTVTAENDQ